MNNDFCTPEGARRLKQRIEAYWAERGYDVNVDLVDAGFMPAMRSARTDVRSNMVNGMPPRNVAANDRAPGRTANDSEPELRSA
ncbi:phosphoglycolate phosphatase [Hyphobacterium marinum]|uniref:Phosphoglycolate phosphatase n=1 Tax=Hyphobacterium marinum TaxID=3116574 RepID=A0ABU7M177_9PROT|nr:phosphoglycolate phosphatase [Hyphobacterium sp. Y6023]MEE2567287.1 phosphoglycolate phosphatase [Hyphobacterium sp. Y6023]